jgi:hypothetical protein
MEDYKEFNPYELVGKVIELRETPGFIWEDNEAGVEDTPTILNGRYEVVEWDANNYEFGLVTEEEGQINRTIPDDQPFSPTIYWVNSEYVEVPEEMVNQVDQLDAAFNAPTVEHPLGPHTGYKLDPTLETVLEEQMIEGGVPESEVDPSINDIEESMDNKLKKSKHVNSMEEDYNAEDMLGKQTVLDEAPAVQVFGDVYTGDYELGTELIWLSGSMTVLGWDGEVYGFVVAEVDDNGNPIDDEMYMVRADYVVPSELAETEIDQLDEQYGMPAVEHPLGEHTGNTGNPQEYVQQWIHYDEPITMEHDGSFVDMQGPFFVAKYIEPKRLFALITQDDYENHKQNNVYYVDQSQVTLDNLAAGEQVDNLQELFEQPSAEHPLGPHTGNMTETEIDQGFRASMERIYRSLLEVGYSADEAQAQVKKLIAEIEQERQAPVEQDVSLDRQTMPAEHLGWYQADFQEKGNEDLELPNIKEEIIMPDEPTGLEKD